YIPREKINFAGKFLESDIIKIITGPRRTGKSVFCILLLKGKDFAYLNFDDENLLKIKNYDEIVKGLYEIYPQAKYVLFDEIQNLDKWELFINKLQRRKTNLILTGSNARLLEKELANVLTGRYVSLEIFPFSFKEFLIAKNFLPNKEELHLPEIKGKILNYLNEYIYKGGFPEVIVKGLNSTYLETLFDAILFKDVIKRHKVRFAPHLYNLAAYLVSNFTSEFSFTKLRNVLGFNSTNTVEKYLSYLQEAYLVFVLNRFSFKVKEQIKSPRKIYIVDNGFITAKSFQLSRNIGKLMENLVFREILRRNFKINRDVFYFKTNNGVEIDFVLKDGIKITKLIQVCYDIDDAKTKERELKGMNKASEELNCNEMEILTWDYEGEEKYRKKSVQFIPLWKWLMDNDIILPQRQRR
ncbi:MAG: ATP-binding protein, partial [Elusimicrobiota bacterium]